MANRRMFSSRIVSSGRFLTMAPSAQALYFHLGINADDDGVVEAYKILKITDSKPDDLRALVDKEFVKVLNGDLVVVILDWREHNLIRPDRKIDSIYKELLLEKCPELQILDAKPRADTGKLSGGQEMDVQMSAQVRLGKVSKNTAAEAANSIEATQSDESGDAIPSKVKKTTRSAKNLSQSRVLAYFDEKCTDVFGYPGPFTFQWKGRKRIEEALQHLSEEQCKEKIEVWFQEMRGSEAALVDIGKCFTQNEITKWKHAGI